MGQIEGYPMSQLLLYYTEHCHLCDEAEALLLASGLAGAYTKVEIDDDPALLALYEIHIPVLKRVADEGELRWPFGPRELQVFLGVG
jgi:hypothetical protein